MGDNVTSETHPSCSNCSETATGDFCHACGQSQKAFERSTLKLLIATAVFLISWDGKFFHTVATLLKKPGQFALDWIEGRQARHIHPIRLIFLSVLCLVALSWTDATLLSAKGHGVFKIENTGDMESIDCPIEDKECMKLKALKGDFKIRAFSLIPKESEKASLQLIYPTQQPAAKENKEDFNDTQELLSGLKFLLKRMDKNPHLADTLLTKSMRNIFILSAPILALIYWLCFLGRGRTLAESGVLSITSHIVIIFLIATGLLLTWISRGFISGLPLIAILLLIATWHIFKAAQSFYGCGTLNGILRGSLVTLLYCTFLLVVIVIGLISSLTS